MPCARRKPSRLERLLPNLPVTALVGPCRVRRNAAAAPDPQDARLQKLDASVSVEAIEASNDAVDLAVGAGQARIHGSSDRKPGGWGGIEGERHSRAVAFCTPQRRT